MAILFLLLLVISVTLWLAARILIPVFRQQKCLSDEDIRNYMLGRLHNDDAEYHRVIGHLVNCEKCQERMHGYEPPSPLEDHLIDDETN